MREKRREGKRREKEKRRERRKKEKKEREERGGKKGEEGERERGGREVQRVDQGERIAAKVVRQRVHDGESESAGVAQVTALGGGGGVLIHCPCCREPVGMMVSGPRGTLHVMLAAGTTSRLRSSSVCQAVS